MSKIGRRPIELLQAKADIKGQEVSISGPKANFIHNLPNQIRATIKDGYLVLDLEVDTQKGRALWGLHRALLANKIFGAQKLFEKKVKIVGLGYKAQISGKKMVFSLGYSHKIDYVLPEGIEVDADRTGQQLVFKSSYKQLLGDVCDTVQGFRPPEPYKGTGIIIEGDVIIRKAGKAKAS